MLKSTSVYKKKVYLKYDFSSWVLPKMSLH